MDQQQKPEMTELKYTEKSRKYWYADGSCAEFKNVIKLGVRPSGTHRLETSEGKKYIILPGWRYIELDMEDWTL